MKEVPLSGLGSLTLASKYFRSMVLTYVYSKDGSKRVVPAIKSVPEAADFNSEEYQRESSRCHDHYKQLGQFFNVFFPKPAVFCNVIGVRF